MNKFNWKNFYSKENANILEVIIKKDLLSVKEISEAFCPILLEKGEICLEDILSYFNGLSLVQKGCLTTHFPPPQEITENMEVSLDYAFKYLTLAGFLSEKIYRLPRDLNRAIEMGLLPKETKHTDLIPDYYENFEAYNWVNIQPCIEPPTLLTYQELQKKLVDFSKDEILMHCINGKLGAYYRVASGKIKLETVSYNTNISELAAYNCGNPFYKTRYDGLEKLTISVLKDMRTNPRTEYQEVEPILPVLPRIFQTTDIETKLHYNQNLYCDKIEIKIEDFLFIHDEVIAIVKENKDSAKRFDWCDFYSKNNAELINDVLMRETITISKLLTLFFPRERRLASDSENLPLKSSTSPEQIFQYFQTEFKSWELNRLKDMLAIPDDALNPIIETTLIKSEPALAMLLGKGFLPQELKRLSRYTEKEIGFEPISDYYAEYDKQFFDSKSNGNLKEFTKLPINYIDDIPYTLTYDQLKKRWEDRNRPNNEIFKQCKNNKLGACLEILESDVIIDCVINSANRLTFYRGFNCGNPFYLKRYKSLEKFIVEDKQRNFDLSNLTKKELLLKPHEHLLHPFETTDFERKFYITRTLKSFKGKNEIKKEDLVFLKEEVENIEKGWPPLESDEYLKEKNEKENVFQFTEETMGMLEAAKKGKEQKKEWSKKGGDAQRKKAEKNWPPIFEIASKKIKEREKEGRCYDSAISLADSILNHIKNHKLSLSFTPAKSTLRKKLKEVSSISKHIKSQ